MAEKGHIPPGDFRRTETATPVEHRAPTKVLPVGAATQRSTFFIYSKFQSYSLVLSFTLVTFVNYFSYFIIYFSFLQQYLFFGFKPKRQHSVLEILLFINAWQ